MLTNTITLMKNVFILALIAIFTLASCRKKETTPTTRILYQNPSDSAFYARAYQILWNQMENPYPIEDYSQHSRKHSRIKAINPVILPCTALDSVYTKSDSSCQ